MGSQSAETIKFRVRFAYRGASQEKSRLGATPGGFLLRLPAWHCSGSAASVPNVDAAWLTRSYRPSLNFNSERANRPGAKQGMSWDSLRRARRIPQGSATTPVVSRDAFKDAVAHSMTAFVLPQTARYYQRLFAAT